jgi:hypothetical protein
MNMRQLTGALVLASACILAAACSSVTQKNTATTTSAAPVAAAALDGLLLTPDQINTFMGTTGISVSQTLTTMFEGNTGIDNKDCLPMLAAQAPVYADSGWTGVRLQYLQEPGDNVTHSVTQAVVSFPAANDAAHFFTTSAQRWPACRQYRSGVTQAQISVGPIANANGTLSTTKKSADGPACQRALTVANNVAIDITACSDSPGNAAVNIAHQIATKVTK